jgi:acid phosphatase (class A)
MLALFVLCTPAIAFEANLVTREQVDAVKLLPPPPAMGSAAQQRDMRIVVEAEKNRTPEQTAKAVADNEISIFRFGDVLGPRFTAAELPVTTKFFQQVNALQRAILVPTKEVWNRPRPFATNPELHPAGELPTSGSYPSGHSHFGYLMGILLAQMVPEKAGELLARGEEYGDNRVLAGVHYPTDVEASRRVAAATATALFANPIFMVELATAEFELRRVLGIAK